MATEGKMDKEINYGFSDSIPTLRISLPFSKSPTYSESNDDNNGQKYYYDIEKTKNAKYLVIKYKGFQSTYSSNLKIENMRFSSIFYIIIGYSFIGIFLVGKTIFSCYKCIKMKPENNKDYDTKNGEIQSPLTPQDNQPYNSNNILNNNNSENPNRYNEQAQTSINYS